MTRNVDKMAEQYRKAVARATPEYQKIIGSPSAPQPAPAAQPTQIPTFLIKKNISRWLRGI